MSKDSSTRLLDMLAGWVDFTIQEYRNNPQALWSEPEFIDKIHDLYQEAGRAQVNEGDMDDEAVKAFVIDKVIPMLLAKATKVDKE